MQAWRLYPRRFSETAFTGVGGLYVAGRWNHLGTAMVYTASSRALAALEYFVNLEPGEAPDDLLMAEAVFADGLIETMEPGLLPADWRTLDNLPCRDLGSAWAASCRSLALRVPSAVVEGDSNFLLNPAHPDFGSVALAEPAPFHFDPRMFRSPAPNPPL
jgi:RES domain-containing protein